MLNIGFVGAGNMAGAIIDAILNSNVIPPNCLSVFDTDKAKLDCYAQKGVKPCSSNIELVSSSDIVILAVKPQVIQNVLAEIKDITKGRCIVSIAAGVTTQSIKDSLAVGTYIMRVLPNTPLLVGYGATVIAEAPEVPSYFFEAVESYFALAGDVVILPEDKINEAIPISSSSPAFFFRFIKAIADSAQDIGISRNIALKLAISTMHGAAHMMSETGRTPEELIAQVTSPNGTTVAALTAFDEYNFEAMMKTAAERCIKRADELGKGK